MTTVSAVSVCNMALGFMGQSELLIDSLDESSNTARCCKVYYDQCRRSLLCEFPWRFAQVTEALPLLGESHPGYRLAYGYPSSCLRLLRIISGEFFSASDFDPGCVFKVARARSGGRCVLTDAGLAYAVYVYDVEDPTEFPPFFVDALAWRLAVELATVLTGTSSLQSRVQLAQFYADSLSHAELLDAGEAMEAPVVRSGGFWGESTL